VKKKHSSVIGRASGLLQFLPTVLPPRGSLVQGSKGQQLRGKKAAKVASNHSNTTSSKSGLFLQYDVSLNGGTPKTPQNDHF